MAVKNALDVECTQDMCVNQIFLNQSEEKMLAKEMIKQCFNCKNAVDCWGLSRIFITKPTNPRDIKITRKTIDIEHLGIDTVHAFHTATTLMYVNAVLPALDSETKKDIISSIVCVVEALTNSSYKEWECPPDQVYEPK